VEYTATANDMEKYATYTRDTLTGLDYAVNRYYSNIWGRFLSPDPSWESADLGDPQTWSRYAYVLNDPINLTDPTGTIEQCPAGTHTSADAHSCVVDSPSASPYIVGLSLNSPAQPFFTLLQSAFHAEYLADQAGTRRESSAIAAQLSAAKGRVRNDLSKPNCARHFTDVNAILSKLNNISIKNLGQLTFATSPGGVINATSNSPGLGQYNPITKSITLNSAVNWISPNSTAASLNGKSWTYPALAAEGVLVGDASITASGLMDITIIHELAHYKGTSNPDAPGAEKVLWKDCIK
jgi:RHS repeat-associated protein